MDIGCGVRLRCEIALTGVVRVLHLNVGRRGTLLTTVVANVCLASTVPAEAQPEVLDFQYPTGRPEFVTPDQPTVIPVNVGPGSDDPVPGTATVSYRIGTSGAFTTVPMTEISPNHYEATLPAAHCTETIQYYFQAMAQSAGVVSDPSDAPDSIFSTISSFSPETVFADNFELDQGWSVTGSVTSGAWSRGVPLGGGDAGDPPTDADGSGQCYLTDPADGDTDVDGGGTTLTSPVMDASDPNSVIAYYRWYSNTEPSPAPLQDVFVVQISDNGGMTWINLETVGPTGPEVDGGWIYKEFKLFEIAGFALNDSFRIRFHAIDDSPQSIVEAGVDGVKLFALDCCPADLTGDGLVNAFDLAILLGDWGPNPGHPADLNDDGVINAADLALMLGSWGSCPAPPQGACCNANEPGECQIMREPDCIGFTKCGDYLGDDTSCADCPPLTCGVPDPACCVLVCAVDSFCCCAGYWDEICAAEADELCG